MKIIKGGRGTGKTTMLINEAVRLLREGKTVVLATSGLANIGTIERQIRDVHDVTARNLRICHYSTMRTAMRGVMDPYILIDEYQRFISRLVSDYLAHESIHMITIQDPLENISAQQ